MEGSKPDGVAAAPFAIAGSLTGIRFASGPARAQAPLRAEVIHWWTFGGESAALRIYAEAFDKACGRWVDTAIAGGANVRPAAVNRVVGGDPPTAMQFNTGKQFDDLVENDLLANVDLVAAAEDWGKTLPKTLVDAVTRDWRDWHAYAVPVNIHGQNWMFFSKAALDRAGATAPTNWDDVFPYSTSCRRPDSSRSRSTARRYGSATCSTPSWRAKAGPVGSSRSGASATRPSSKARCSARRPRATEGCIPTSIRGARATTGTTRRRW